VNVAPTAPSLFTYDASGSGQVAAINVGDGTLNTAGNPARIGDFISFFATGAGQTSPGGVDGKLAPLTLPIPAPSAKVSVTIGGVPAVLNYAGGVPGAVAGLMQINAQIPKGVTPGGYVPVVVTIGDSSTVSDAVWISVSD
jgi:uncharacterized protein (TIGR03437 family)